MSLHTFTIHDKKLGFVLDKSSKTPTISKITDGGALEKLLIDSCSTVTIGSQIQFVQDESVKGLSYEKALDKIKSYIERPINIVVTSPRKETIPTPIPSENQNYRKKMTVEEMNKASDEATSLGLKELVRAHKEKQLESYSDDYTSDEENTVSYTKFNSLENKNHLLKMEMLNMKIVNEENAELMDKQLNPLKTLNDSLCQIVSLRKRSFLKVKNISSEEMTEKVKKINFEYQEYLLDCEKNIKQIELHEIKNCVIQYLDKDQEDMDKLNIMYGNKIYVKNILECIQSISLIVVCIAILVGMVVYSK